VTSLNVGSDVVLSRPSAGRLGVAASSGDSWIQIGGASVGVNTILSFRDSGAEKWRLWKLTGNDLAFYDTVNSRTMLKMYGTGLMQAQGLPDSSAGCALEASSSSTWDANKATKRLQVSHNAGFSNGLPGRGLANNDVTTDDTINGIGGAFTQWEGFSFRTGTLNFNDRGSLIGFLSTPTLAQVAATTAITASPNGVQNSGGSVLITSTGHGLVTGDSVKIAGSTGGATSTGGGPVGTTGVNANWVVTVVDANNFTLNGSVYGGTTGGGGTVQKFTYHEIDAYIGNVICNSHGAFSQTAELDNTPTVPARAANIMLSCNPSIAYSNWNDPAIFGATSAWIDTGMRGLQIQNTAGAKNGTAIFLNSVNASFPWTRAIVLNNGSGANNKGTDVWTLDGLGNMGFGAVVNQTTNTNGLPAKIVFATDTTAAGGMQFGTTSPALLYRSAANELNLGNTSLALNVTGAFASNTGPAAASTLYMRAGRTTTFDLGRTSGAVLQLWKLTAASAFPANPALSIAANGTVSWGDGSAATDNSLARADANTMSFTNSLQVGTSATIAVDQAAVICGGTRALTAGVTDGYVGGLTLGPGYSGAFTVTRHNYITLGSVLLSSTTLTDAAVFRFNAAVGTHAALAAAGAVAITIGAGPTGSTAGNPQGFFKLNVNGTLRYVPFW
jgi:hypothetical protein